MSVLVAAWRVARVALHVADGLWRVMLPMATRTEEARRQRVRWWACGLLRALGLRLEVQGSFRPGAKLIVANHISWVDIMAVHAVCPEARFVSKADVQHWPLLARLVRAAGTLYIRRERTRDALRVVHEMAEALRSGDTVAVFPEGTTADGHALMPFHANLLQAAIATRTPVQPVAIGYSDAFQSVSAAAAYVGETTLLQSLWRLARGRRIIVHLTVLPAQASARADRRALAQRLRDDIHQVLHP